MAAEPALLLLHGFANSSHYFRYLLPRLAGRFHLLAPDIPSFGFTQVTDAAYRYNFEQLTATVHAFVNAMDLQRFAMYVFDYGAPIGFNLAVAEPERITGIISQNANVYEEGLALSPWEPLRQYWRQPSQQIRDAIKARMTPDSVRQVYLQGVPEPTAVEPESYLLDAALLQRPGVIELQVDLKLDYRSNFANYPAYQNYLRGHRPPLLAIWGEHDPFFLPAGARAFQRDVPSATVQLLNTGHFALETHPEQIAVAIERTLIATR